MNSNHRGAIAEAAIAYEAAKAGVEVLRPVAEHCRYDLVFDIGASLLKVQCKSAYRRGAVLCVNLTSSWHTPGGCVPTRYEADELDLVGVHCPKRARAIWSLSSSWPVSPRFSFDSPHPGTPSEPR